MTYSDRNLGALPLGELHDAGRCARCGLRGVAGKQLMRTVLVDTNANAMVCKDTHACLRRRTNKRKGRL